MQDNYFGQINSGPIEIPFEVEKDSDFEKFLQQLQKETELSPEIEQKIKDVFHYMWKNNLYKIESIYTHGFKFVMEIERGEAE